MSGAGVDRESSAYRSGYVSGQLEASSWKYWTSSDSAYGAGFAAGWADAMATPPTDSDNGGNDTTEAER